MKGKRKLSDQNLDKVAGGAVFKIECQRCGKDLTQDKGNVLAKLEDKGSWTAFYWCCPDCVKDEKGFKHLYTQKQEIDPSTGKETSEWVKTSEELEFINKN